LRDSTRGKLTVEALSQRVWLWNNEETAAHCWHLIVRREIGAPNEIKFTLSNAAPETSLERLGFMQGQRFWVERSFQDGKSTCGMADYQVRRWSGWHHHMAMVMIAMLFMAEERAAQQASEPLLSCADIVALLKHFLPQAAVTREDAIAQMRFRHRQRQASIDAAYAIQAKRLK
jgi:SRSO17 transposase